MTKNRIEAYSDAVIAILITIMVLELKVPHGTDFSALRPLIPVFLSYILSFIYLGIYWNNHHHLFQAVRHIKGGSLWANAHLLFWLSLIPFASGWMGENHFAPLPVAVYGGVLLCCAMAYWILVRVLLKHHERDSVLAKAIGRDLKGNFSVVLYLLGIGLAFTNRWLACAMYVIVAIMWLVPDRRIEKNLMVEALPNHNSEK